MDKRTLTALQASIEKWEKNSRVRVPHRAKTWGDSCQLCKLFAKYDCNGCPVAESTRVPFCQNTPWGEANSKKYLWSRGQATREEFRAAAKAEADFLRSLLPPFDGEFMTDEMLDTEE